MKSSTNRIRFLFITLLFAGLPAAAFASGEVTGSSGTAAVATANMPAAVDPSLSVDEAGAECIIALAVEKAGSSYSTIKNPLASAFKAGECAGKIQTYMLRMQAENPECFPKISLEEGMDIFVKWAAANAYRANMIEYPEGFRQAFEAAVPCLRKNQ